jgi:phenylpropionate dioxygenase-like ring-hydroxylating dioxygenase large terminal subunit
VTDDTCTHGQASLSDGFVVGDEIECPWHSGRFCIRDGRATGAAGGRADPVYPTRVVDGAVCIEAAPPPDAADAEAALAGKPSGRRPTAGAAAAYAALQHH